jgi:tetratricopeptide (TPR) repeat protein
MIIFGAMKTLRILLLLVSASLSAGGAFHLDNGNQAYQKGNYQDAYEQYQLALRKGENPIMARFNMANSLYQLKQVGRSLAMYELLIQDAPAFVRPYINAGGIYFSMDEVGNALQLYGRALEVDPRNTTTLKMMGECWLKLSDRGRAIEFFSRGLSIEPENSAWYYAIVDVYLGINDYAAARDVLVKAIRETGENPQFIFYLAEMEIALEDWVNAASHLQQGLDLNPEQKGGWSRLAFVHESMNNPYLAVMALKEGMNGGYMDGTGWLECGRILMSAGEYSQAFDSFRNAALKGIPKAREGLLLLAWKMRESGNRTRAIQVLEASVQLFPGDLDVAESLSDFNS